jgi:4,5-dihydroxyphthalate decarboxylase
MHLLVVRRALVEEHPTLPTRLYAAFDAARRLAAADLVARDFPKLTLPWLIDHASTTRTALDGDPWTYGLEANHDVLATMLAYAVADGLADARTTVNDLFA